MGLNPLATMVFMYIGYKIGGIVAMIIAVPVGLILINLYEAGTFDDIMEDVRELAKGLNEYREGEIECFYKLLQQRFHQRSINLLALVPPVAADRPLPAPVPERSGSGR